MESNKSGLRHKLQSFLLKFQAKINNRAVSDSAILIGTAILVGIGSGLGAVLFTFLIESARKIAFEDAINALNIVHPWHLIIIPIIGALITGPIIYLFAREAKGHGVPEVMMAVALRGGKIKPQVGIVKAITSAICIGTGGSVGSEGPIAQIGSALGSTIGQFLKLNEERTKTLVACGAAGGIAAIFNAPIAGAIFAMEVILNRISSVYFGAVVISAVIADSIAHFFMGDFRTFMVPQYFMESPWELLLYSLLAILAAFASVGFSRLLYIVEDLFDDIRLPAWIKPSIGALLLGILGIFTMKTAEGFPRIFGVGYESMTPALFGEFTLNAALLLFFFKLLATLFTLGSGNSGGIFAPSLFMGSMLGAGFGSWATSVFPNITTGAGAYSLVGMASFFSGATHAPMTAILILFEMTNNYQLILPLMLASVLSTIISRVLSKDSIYTLKLSRRGINLSQTQDIDVMQGIFVGDVMNTDFQPIRANQTIQELEEILENTHSSGLPVLNNDDRLIGVVTTRDLRAAHTMNLPKHTIVSEIITTTDLITTHSKEPMWQAIFHMSTHDISLLPVIEEEEPWKLVGMIYRQDVIKAYDQAITRKAKMQHEVEIIKLGKLDEAKFLHLNIPTNSQVIGKRVSEINLPDHCVIVSIRRGRKLIIVDGKTILRKGDYLTIFIEEGFEKDLENIFTGQYPEHPSHRENDSIHEEILIKAGSQAIGKMIKELNLPGDTLIVNILRNEEVIIPHGETIIRLNDEVEIFGNQKVIEQTRLLFEPD